MEEATELSSILIIPATEEMDFNDPRGVIQVTNITNRYVLNVLDSEKLKQLEANNISRINAYALWKLFLLGDPSLFKEQKSWLYDGRFLTTPISEGWYENPGVQANIFLICWLIHTISRANKLLVISTLQEKLNVWRGLRAARNPTTITNETLLQDIARFSDYFKLDINIIFPKLSSGQFDPLALLEDSTQAKNARLDINEISLVIACAQQALRIVQREIRLLEDNNGKLEDSQLMTLATRIPLYSGNAYLETRSLEARQSPLKSMDDLETKQKKAFDFFYKIRDFYYRPETALRTAKQYGNMDERLYLYLQQFVNLRREEGKDVVSEGSRGFVNRVYAGYSRVPTSATATATATPTPAPTSSVPIPTAESPISVPVRRVVTFANTGAGTGLATGLAASIPSPISPRNADEEEAAGIGEENAASIAYTGTDPRGGAPPPSELGVVAGRTAEEQEQVQARRNAAAVTRQRTRKRYRERRNRTRKS